MISPGRRPFPSDGADKSLVGQWPLLRAGCHDSPGILVGGPQLSSIGISARNSISHPVDPTGLYAVLYAGEPHANAGRTSDFAQGRWSFSADPNLDNPAAACFKRYSSEQPPFPVM